MCVKDTLLLFLANIVNKHKFDIGLHQARSKTYCSVNNARLCFHSEHILWLLLGLEDLPGSQCSSPQGFPCRGLFTFSHTQRQELKMISVKLFWKAVGGLRSLP